MNQVDPGNEDTELAGTILELPSKIQAPIFLFTQSDNFT